MFDFDHPIRINGQRVWRPFIGGCLLDRLQQRAHPQDGEFPEEWILSTTRAKNMGREGIEEGLCRLANGEGKTSLKELVESFPRQLLGAAHTARLGPATGLLVKLIDAKVRLPVQVHPNGAMARELFHSAFGKTECWHILGIRDDLPEPPCIYLGFREGITKAAWQTAFQRQDISGLLTMLHRFPAQPGDTFLVPGGVPHAIGGGCFLMEVQEPTDLTIRLERKTSYGLRLDGDALHQGLGYERMFDCFIFEGYTGEQALHNWKVPVREAARGTGYQITSLVDQRDSPCFQLRRIVVSNQLRLSCGDRFSGLYIWSGNGELQSGRIRQPLAPDSQFFVPASCVSLTIRCTGDRPLTVFQFFGPEY